ncbi:MAG: hypothetical protein DDT32_02315 [Syntrophomonadaceae bacterium]|nr:hypothetical protein [Bacillota bacterium]
MKNQGLEIEDSGEPGIIMGEPTGDLEPPIKDIADEPELPTARQVTGKIPISSAVIKPPLRFEGLLLSQLTGYPGWIYTEEDLDEIAKLVQSCGYEATPAIQLLLVMAGLHGAKFGGYLAWKKAGRPGDLRKKESKESNES